MNDTFKEWFASEQLKYRHSRKWAKEGEVIRDYQPKTSAWFNIYCWIMFFVFIPVVFIGILLSVYFITLIIKLSWPLLATAAHISKDGGAWITLGIFVIGCILIWKQTFRLAMMCSVYSYYWLARYFAKGSEVGY